MKLHIALTAYIVSLSASSTFSLEGFKCRDYPVANGDSFGPPRTIRVCGVMELESGYSYFPQIENRARPANSLSQRLYGGRDGVWSTLQYQTSSLSNNRHSPNNVPEIHFAGSSKYSLIPPTFRAFRQISLDNIAGSNVLNELGANNVRENKQPMTEQQLNTLAEDVSEMKNSMKDLTTYLKTSFDNQLRHEENINVNLKLDPSFETIVKQFLQLTEQSFGTSNEKKAEPSSTENTEYVESSSEYLSLSSEESTTENGNNSDENTTTKPDENSTENVSNEDEQTSEDFNSWLNHRFGPKVNNRDSDEEIEDMFSLAGEENSPEKSEESFETWFNNVYRRIPTEVPSSENSNSEENTNDSNADTNENTANESNENSKSTEDSNNENEYLENVSSQVSGISKSSEESKVSNENANNNDEANIYYDTIFLPRTVQQTEEASNVEYLENGDRYGYADIHAAQSEEVNWSNCLRLTISVKNFDDNNFRRKCVDQFYARARKASENLAVSESNESGEENTENIVALTDSKKSTERNSNESKSSSETDTPPTDFDETKESSETEAAVTDSNASEENNESASSISDSNLSSENFANDYSYDWP
ncbi:uncharacterized protein [Eurosta solidaginis]|uniref:uncharacterized protein n=1 Tax=Eurosta solidaginis TaxID=178769 RepID=UPI003530EB87